MEPAKMRYLLLPLVALLAACSRGGRTSPIEAPRPVGLPERVESAPTPTTPRPTYTAPLDPWVSDTDLDALWSRQLMVPVDGLPRRKLKDDFTAKRDGGRIHGALDIQAARSTPVLAADDCVIGRMFSGPIGGIVIYASSPDGQFVYYYAHLQQYRDGLAVGDRVAKGSVIGYVGTTGNAPPSTPHLHFQVMKRGHGRVWWDGPPINPIFFFAVDGLRR